MRKKLLLLIYLITNTYLANAQKVGLVFSGGGAKGLAHIGTLKALEENNIPIDYITGTSMGAIVGAMYAAGYSPAQIERIALSHEFQDWVNGRYQSDYSFFFQKANQNPSVISAKMAIDTSLRLSFRPNLVNDIPLNFALLELFSPASAVAKDNFNNLMVPFRCMVADVFSQESVVISKGSLPDAVRGSMTVPLVYRPIKLDDKYVFDGGIYNNFPADVMQKEFNPNVIIGSNVSSKNFKEYPKDDDRVMNKVLIYMFLAKSDSTLVGKNGIYLQPNISQFSSTSFSQVKDIINEGYLATLSEIGRIKQQIKRSVSQNEIDEKRANFNQRKTDLVFSEVLVTGLNNQQKKYIIRLFKRKGKTFKLSDIQEGYYKLVADEVFEAVYPKITYQAATDSYIFEINAKPKNNLKIDLGGNISTRPISNVYLGVQYNRLNRKAYTVNTNFYSGRFYESVQLAGRIDFPSTLPLFLATDLTYNHWNYYNTSKIFVQNPNPTYIEQSDRKIDLKLGMPLNNNGRVVFNTAFISNSDKYSPTNEFTVGNLLDKTTFNGYKFGITLEKNNLNRKQYASLGKHLYINISFTKGTENFTEGNILPINIDPIKKDREWVSAKISQENYLLKTKGYTLGYQAELAISNQPLFSNYYASLLSAPAFYPLQDSKSIFVNNLRAHNYFAGGLKNIINIKRKFDLRLEGYVFLPYKEFKQIGLQGVTYEKALLKWNYAATAGLVYQTPVGPISLSYNHYNDYKNKHGVLLHIGYLIYNKRSLE